MGENEAYLDRQSGKIYWHSEFGDNDEKLPNAIDDEKYILILDRKELHLGKALVFNFVREFLPDDYDEVRQIFNRREALTANSRICWCGGAPSNGGMIFRTRQRKRLCGSGARRTGSTQRELSQSEQYYVAARGEIAADGADAKAFVKDRTPI